MNQQLGRLTALTCSRPVQKPRVATGDPDRRGLGVQSLAVARGARKSAHVFFELGDMHAVLAVSILGQQVGDDTAKGSTVFDGR